MTRTVRSEVGEVTVRETGIVYARAFPNAEIHLKEAKEYHTMVEYLTGRREHVTVIDITGISYMSAEARAHLQHVSNEWGKTLALGLVTNSFTAKVIGNFFLTLNRPNYPVKLFTDTVEAYNWALDEYLKTTARAAS